MDFATLDLNEKASKGVRVELLHPGDGSALTDEQGEPLYIICLGADSDEWRKTMKRVKAQQARAGGSKDAATLMDTVIIETMAQCTKEWSGSIELDGEAMECTADNARTLYSRIGWIGEQVYAAVSDRSRYFLA